MDAFRKGIQKVTFVLCFGGMFLLIPMMLITATDVVSRGIWRWPIPGAVELSSYMLAIFILLGVAYTHQVKGHVRVTILTSRLPDRAEHLVGIVTNLLSFFIIGLMAWQGWVVGIEETTVSDMLRVPQLPFRLLVFVAGVFLCAELVIDLVLSVKKVVEG
jgi:TRAP-type C4-dicarboxylate transport system permease small subunit